jgi:hypothetical protein
MTGSAKHLRRLLAVAVLSTGLLAVPAAAQAAKVKISGKAVTVGAKRVAAVKLTNPNRSSAKGTLTLKWQGVLAGARSFKIPARKSRKVKVKLRSDLFDLLTDRGKLKVKAAARAKRKGTARRTITLRVGKSGSRGVGGGGSGGGGSQGSGQGWDDGRYQGRYEENAIDLAFNIVGRRFFTGPFDGFYITANCHDADGPQTDYTDSTVIEPVEAAIASNGDFEGSGVYNTGSIQIPWAIAGHVQGTAVAGAFAVEYNDDYGNPCSGTTQFTGEWYGDYTL